MDINTDPDINNKPHRTVDKPGYKKTKLGWIPEEWEVVRLRQLISRLDSGKSVNCMKNELSEFDVAILKTSAVTNGTFEAKEVKIPLEEEKDKLKVSVKIDRLLICRKNTPDLVGCCVLTNNNYSNLFIPDLIWQTVPNNRKEHSIKFLYLMLNENSIKQRIGKLANGSSRSMVNISKNSFLNISIPLPPLLEQQKIATILSTWDQAIDLTKQLIEAKEEQKKGLMQWLLIPTKESGQTPELRVKGFSQDWVEVKLGSVFRERKEKGCGNLELLSIGVDGVYPQSESNKKDNSNSNKSKYKRICPGDIGYNTMRMWQGRSAVSKLEGIVSPAYTIVTPKNGIDVNFMGNLFQLPETIHSFWRYSQGLVGDTLNCKFPSFALVKVKIPPTYEEQVAISTILKTADDEREILVKKLNELQEQKRGLMQRLLTGKIRIINN